MKTSSFEAWIIATAEDNNFHGLPLVNLTLETVPKLNVKSRKTGEPCKFKKVIKLASRVYMLARMGSYENKANNLLEKQGAERDFEAKALFNGYGERFSIYLARNTRTGLLYLTGFPQSKDGKIISGKTEYYGDGKLLTEEEVTDLEENFLQKSYLSTIPYNTIGLNSLRQATFFGATVQIEPEQEAEAA